MISIQAEADENTAELSYREITRNCAIGIVEHLHKPDIENGDIGSGGAVIESVLVGQSRRRRKGYDLLRTRRNRNCWLNRTTQLDRGDGIVESGGNSAVYHEGGQKCRRAGDAVLAVDQDPLTGRHLLAEPGQRFGDLLLGNQAGVGSGNPFISFTGMLGGLIASRWIVAVTATHVEDGRDARWILTDQGVGIGLSA